MPRLLLINPNTTAAVTGKVAAAAAVALPGVAITPVTGRFGTAYISSRASFAVAAHAALDAFAAHAPGHDAVLLACFGDPGLDALREISPVPVIGLVEAACAEAAHDGRRFAIVTGGERWGPMLTEMIAQRGLGDALAALVTVAPTGGQIAEDPDAALALLAESCEACARDHGAQAVILGGAGLIGLAGRVAPRVGVPGLWWVGGGVRAAAPPRAGGQRGDATTVATPSIGLSAPLEALFSAGQVSREN